MKETERMSQDELKKMRRMSYIKMVAMVGIVVAILAFSSIAWFTMNREVEGSGVQMTASDLPFELKASGTDILFTQRLGEVAPRYVDGETVTGGRMTSGGKAAIRWVMTSQSNMQNLRENGDTTSLADITSLESDKYGLSPGDHGTISFTVVPTNKASTLNIDFNTLITCYAAEYDDGYEDTDEELTIIDDSNITNYLKGHILFFYETEEKVDGEQVTKLNLLDDTGFTFSIMDDTEITIHWVWPETLNNILTANITGLDSAASQTVRTYMFNHPEYFLQRLDTPAAGEAPFSEMSLSTVNESNISTVSTSIVASSRKYEKYSTWYNNADQTIGDEVAYITFELTASTD